MGEAHHFLWSVLVEEPRELQVAMEQSIAACPLDMASLKLTSIRIRWRSGSTTMTAPHLCITMSALMVVSKAHHAEFVAEPEHFRPKPVPFEESVCSDHGC